MTLRKTVFAEPETTSPNEQLQRLIAVWNGYELTEDTRVTRIRMCGTMDAIQSLLNTYPRLRAEKLKRYESNGVLVTMDGLKESQLYSMSSIQIIGDIKTPKPQSTISFLQEILDVMNDAEADERLTDDQYMSAWLEGAKWVLESTLVVAKVQQELGGV